MSLLDRLYLPFYWLVGIRLLCTPLAALTLGAKITRDRIGSQVRPQPDDEGDRFAGQHEATGGQLDTNLLAGNQAEKDALLLDGPAFLARTGTHTNAPSARKGRIAYPNAHHGRQLRDSSRASPIQRQCAYGIAGCEKSRHAFVQRRPNAAHGDSHFGRPGQSAGHQWSGKGSPAIQNYLLVLEVAYRQDSIHSDRGEQFSRLAQHFFRSCDQWR